MFALNEIGHVIAVNWNVVSQLIYQRLEGDICRV
jgi:hypothetical protein